MAPNLFGNSLLVTAEGTIAVDDTSKTAAAAESTTQTLHTVNGKAGSGREDKQEDSSMVVSWNRYCCECEDLSPPNSFPAAQEANAGGQQICVAQHYSLPVLAHRHNLRILLALCGQGQVLHVCLW